MTQERWQRLEELFYAALEQPEAARRRFVEEACGEDAGLRDEIERLLRNDPQTISDTTGSSPIADRVRRVAVMLAFPPRHGDRIGHYRVMDEIGHGGMGLVYRATRADQEFHMQVAIKVAKTGMDTATILERFRRERQILANLDHRYIAKLLDGGTTSDGLPYFVMEYVEGVAIHTYAQNRNLSLADRLILFRGVCEAVAYAHQNLVMHLDLKPANILITADGTPKLLDFGISRLMDAPLSSDAPPPDSGTALPSGSTAAFGRLLTPDYASPEQVRGEALTTAADVYSLGAVLYQLLTGELPHVLDGLTPRQMERTICALDVVRPSERIPARRRVFAGDLDHIVMKALAKDATERYRSVQELDEELGRYLSGFPVRARQGSRFYKFGKFLWRNRLAAAAVVAAFISLAGGLAVARWQARQAEEQRHVAESESNRAEMNAAQAQRNAAQALENLHRAESAQRDALDEKKLADQRFEDVRQLSTTYLFDFNDALADSPGTLKVRRTMVDQGIRFLDGLSRQAGNSAQLQLSLAGAYMRLGDLLGNPNLPNLGDTKAAMESYRKALPMVEVPAKIGKSVPNHVERDDYLLAQEQLHGKIGQLLSATGLEQDSIAESALAGRLARDLLQRHEGDLRFDAVAAETLSVHSQLLASRGMAEGALASALENRPLLQRLVARHPADPDFAVCLGSDYSAEGRAMSITGNLKGSMEAYQKDVDLLEDVQQKFPHNLSRDRMLMFAYSHLGDVMGNPQLRNLGDYAGAEAAYEKMSRIADESAARDPENSLVHLDAAMSVGRLGGLRLAQGNPAAAVPALQRAVTGLESVAAKDPRNRSSARFLAYQYELMGDAQDALGQLAAAKTSYSKVISGSEQLLHADANELGPSTALVEGHLKLGLILSQEGDPKAIDEITLAIARNLQNQSAHAEVLPVKLRTARCFGGRALAAYRLATRPGIAAEERAKGLRQAREDLERADQILAELPSQRIDLAAARSLSVVSEARKLLAEAR
jgi:serine/threonine protein kinase